MRAFILALLLGACDAKTRVLVDGRCSTTVVTDTAGGVVVKTSVQLVPVLIPMPQPYKALAEKP